MSSDGQEVLAPPARVQSGAEFATLDDYRKAYQRSLEDPEASQGGRGWGLAGALLQEEKQGRDRERRAAADRRRRRDGAAGPIAPSLPPDPLLPTA